MSGLETKGLTAGDAFRQWHQARNPAAHQPITRVGGTGEAIPNSPAQLVRNQARLGIDPAQLGQPKPVPKPATAIPSVASKVRIPIPPAATKALKPLAKVGSKGLGPVIYGYEAVMQLPRAANAVVDLTYRIPRAAYDLYGPSGNRERGRQFMERNWDEQNAKRPWWIGGPKDPSENPYRKPLSPQPVPTPQGYTPIAPSVPDPAEQLERENSEMVSGTIYDFNTRTTHPAGNTTESKAGFYPPLRAEPYESNYAGVYESGIAYYDVRGAFYAGNAIGGFLNNPNDTGSGIIPGTQWTRTYWITSRDPNQVEPLGQSTTPATRPPSENSPNPFPPEFNSYGGGMSGLSGAPGIANPLQDTQGIPPVMAPYVPMLSGSSSAPVSSSPSPIAPTSPTQSPYQWSKPSKPASAAPSATPAQNPTQDKNKAPLKAPTVSPASKPKDPNGEGANKNVPPWIIPIGLGVGVGVGTVIAVKTHVGQSQPIKGVTPSTPTPQTQQQQQRVQRQQTNQNQGQQPQPKCQYDRSNISGKVDVANTTLNTVNTFMQTQVMGTVNTVNSKLGDALPGGLSGALTKAWKFARVDKILGALNTFLILHNAAMLSRSLGLTLGDLASQALALTGIKDENGQPIDINAELGKQLNDMMANMLGADVWSGTKLAWNKANTIIRTAANIIWSIREIFDSIGQILEWIAENLGKVGNALKRYKVVGDRAYPWMSEQHNANNHRWGKVMRYTQSVDSLDDAASSLSSVISEVANVGAEFNELKQNRVDFDRQLKEWEPRDRPDNDTVALSVATGKEASASPVVPDGDKLKGEPPPTP